MKTIAPLKQAFPGLNRALALPSQKDEGYFYRNAQADFKYRTFYPAKNSIRGFGECAEKYLNSRCRFAFEMGENIKNSKGGGIIVEMDGRRIRHNLVWTLDVSVLSSILFKKTWKIMGEYR